MRFDQRFRMAVGALGLILLLLLGLAGAVGAEEVVVEQYPDSNYAPGPGRPEGWSPPPPPAALPEQARQYYDQVLKDYPQFRRLELRVLEPLPTWTKEYPYRWAWDDVECGDTLYVYFYPVPDTTLISKTYDRTFIHGRLGSLPCQFTPVRFISEVQKPSEESRAADQRMIAVQEEMERSRNGLPRHLGTGKEGNPDHVYVFLNNGLASDRFDVPAYLDPTIGRVRVPIRFISELMGAAVTWDDAAGRVTIQFPPISRAVLKAVPADGYAMADFFAPRDFFPDPFAFLLEEQTVTTPERTIVLTVGQPRALVDGREVNIDAPPVITEGRTMVPVRFVAEQMGCKVYWVGDQPIFDESDGTRSGTYQVQIFTPFFPLYDYPSWFLESRAVNF